MRKPTKKEAVAMATVIITILMALGYITACTNSLFVVKGQANKIKTENNQNVKADSTTVEVGVNKK
ncbi:hypothetical protein [Microvirus mar40]|uniref:Uncharacterized protein n=1 Tax=Microvirus mar40 TaxID=2851175 RepID=A0A8F5XRC4_9VIRU|nr:hypothetical protein [Microvirus mar40]